MEGTTVVTLHYMYMMLFFIAIIFSQIYTFVRVSPAKRIALLRLPSLYGSEPPLTKVGPLVIITVRSSQDIGDHRIHTGT